eukprot:CAMPEP_0194532036 /NCGR_PEP_ID=MMETSP0253-20130528/69486_1 /TAXON_ID=2966 /ORGANISM="Noctiluca scintillans" /LENGTH=78 /DNA_ID=CAMNT_0039377435 /DNA_START=470 /DNA_END=706 /DNA_ORIENTATION=+
MAWNGEVLHDGQRDPESSLKPLPLRGPLRPLQDSKPLIAVFEAQRVGGEVRNHAVNALGSFGTDDVYGRAANRRERHV